MEAERLRPAAPSAPPSAPSAPFFSSEQLGRRLSARRGGEGTKGRGVRGRGRGRGRKKNRVKSKQLATVDIHSPLVIDEDELPSLTTPSPSPPRPSKGWYEGLKWPPLWAPCVLVRFFPLFRSMILDNERLQ